MLEFPAKQLDIVARPSHNHTEDHIVMPAIEYIVYFIKFMFEIPAGIDIIDLMKGKKRHAKTNHS